MKFYTLENNKIVRVAFFLIVFLLFLYVVVRAYHMSFTHDESLTYQTIKGLPDFARTANNHLLNTRLAKWSAALFGFSELALRLPNVAAFALYLYFVYRLFFRATALSFLALPFFVLNPFILDFFSLARGYGLAIAFFTGSLYYFIEHISYRGNKYLSFALILGVLSVYANFSFLTALMALCLACFFYYVRSRKIDFKVAPLLYLLSVAALYPAYAFIKILQAENQLYFGGDKNIIEDSLYSIIRCSFHGQLFAKSDVAVLISALLIYVLALLVKKSEGLKYTLVAIAITLAVPELLNTLVGMKFPIERSVLYLPVLMGFCVKYALESAEADGYKLIIYPLLLLIAGVSLLHVVNFSRTANITSTQTWAYDASTRSALQILQTRINPTKKYKLGCSWLFEPTINYYRETKKLTWLEPVFRHNYSETNNFSYVLKGDEEYKASSKTVRIASFPQTESVLLDEGVPKDK